LSRRAHDNLVNAYALGQSQHERNCVGDCVGLGRSGDSGHELRHRVLGDLSIDCRGGHQAFCVENPWHHQTYIHLQWCELDSQRVKSRSQAALGRRVDALTGRRCQRTGRADEYDIAPPVRREVPNCVAHSGQWADQG
jgi:hypothetical protein